MEEDPYIGQIEAVSREILRITLEEDATDLEVRAKILALQCKQEQLEYQRLKWDDAEPRIVEMKHKQLSESQKRWHQAESQKKNKILPLILKRLDEWQSGASAIRDKANKPVFSEDDEEI